MTTMDVVIRKLDAHEPASTILRSIPPADRATVTAWGAVELSFQVLDATVSDHVVGPPNWPRGDAGAYARALARLLVAIWTDPATPKPEKERIP